MSEFHNLGTETMVGILRTGDYSPLRQLINDVNSADPRTKSIARAALEGAALAIVDVCDQLEVKRKARLTGDRLSRAQVRYAFAKATPADMSRVLQLATNWVAALRKHNLHTGVSLIRTESAAAPAPVPTPVAVVSMPLRKTTTDIERNASGDITGSVQIERDGL